MTNFHSDISTKSVIKPKPRKTSDEQQAVIDSTLQIKSGDTEESTLENIDEKFNKAVISEEIARRFADSFIGTLFLTNNNMPSDSQNTSNKQYCDRDSSTSIVSSSPVTPSSSADFLNVSGFKSDANDSFEDNMSSVEDSELRELVTDFVNDILYEAIAIYQRDVDREESFNMDSSDVYKDNISNTETHSKTYSDLHSDIDNITSFDGDVNVISSSSFHIHTPSSVIMNDNSTIASSYDGAEADLFRSSTFVDSLCNDNNYPEDSQDNLEENEAPPSHPGNIHTRLSIPEVLITLEKGQKKEIENTAALHEIANKLVQEQVEKAISIVSKTNKNQTEKGTKTALKCKSKNMNELEPPRSKYGSKTLHVGSDTGNSQDEKAEPRKVTFFASSLSRDLLTNAFVEVQRNANGGNIFRRSSEPIKISNQATQSLMNGSKANGTRFHSLTDEDIGKFAQELSRWGSLDDISYREKRRGTCGFRDPTLSRLVYFVCLYFILFHSVQL